LDPSSRVAVTRQILNWFLPGGDFETSWEISVPKVTSYSGGHATDHDSLLRSDLHELVARLDRDSFDGMIEALNKEFRCGLEA
jgi:hypothetical protein